MIKAVLFDLGKVLLHFNFEPAFRKLAKASRRPISPKDVEDYFVSSGIEVLFDGGKIGPRRFYREVREALDLNMSYEAFSRAWCGIFTPNPPMIRLVKRLRTRGRRLILASNTNELHFRHLLKRYPFLKLFHRRFASYREGMRKPDERLYRKAVRAAKARAHEVFYIDDRRDLTHAAESLGIVTYTYRYDTPALLKRMKELEIL